MSTNPMSAEEISRHLEENGCIKAEDRQPIPSWAWDDSPTHYGVFGTVYKNWSSAVPRVVKTTRLSLALTDSNKKMLKVAAHELQSLSRFRHENVVSLIGHTVFQKEIGIVFERLRGAVPLREYIKTSYCNRCKLSISLADGLGYLHLQDFVHGNLKGDNVLITAGGVLKIAGFGSTVLRANSESITYLSYSDSLRWTAPELLDNREYEYSEETDIFALGMTILETITGEVPYSGCGDPVVKVYMKANLAPDQPSNLSTGSQRESRLWSLLKRCWVDDPYLRPSARIVRDELANITGGWWDVSS